jgi:hypothetical protein
MADDVQKINQKIPILIYTGWNLWKTVNYKK